MARGGNSFRNDLRRGRSLGPVVALVLIAAVAVVLFGAPPFDSTREQARHAQCRHHLRMIELALGLYHDNHGSFPPAVTYGPDGRAWHSWRALLVPYLERGERVVATEYRFDEPWDSPHNREAAASISSAAPFFCYADEAAQRDRTTSYVAVVGEGTMWPADGSATRRSEAKDGPAATAHVVEMADSGILWTEPKDLRLAEMTFEVNTKERNGLRSFHPGEPRWFGRRGPKRVNAGFLDGKARPIEVGTEPEVVRSLLLRGDGGPKSP